MAQTLSCGADASADFLFSANADFGRFDYSGNGGIGDLEVYVSSVPNAPDSSGTWTISAAAGVPEPAPMGCVMAGLLAAGGAFRRRRSSCRA